MKAVACALLICAALLSGCVAPPSLPSTPPPPAPQREASPAASPPPAAASPAPVAATPSPTGVNPATVAVATAAEAPVTPDTATPTPAVAGAVTVATVAPKSTSPVPVASATSELSGLTATEVITPANSSATTYRVSEITLATYPYAQFLSSTTDPNVGGYPVLSLDRAAYEASNPRPAPRSYKLLILENRYLRLSILPELGGRIYECVFKPTGSNEFYSNTVVKPTTWGPASPPNVPGANWWPAAGGLEWGFPVEDQGYEFGSTWGYDHAGQDDGGVMITVYTQTGPEKPYAVVDIILPPDTAYFVVQPRIVNPLGAPFNFKWWSSALLAPGPANSPDPDTRFVFPVGTVEVQRAAGANLPAAGQKIAWPAQDGRDLSRIGNIDGYMKFLREPAAQGAFMGVYDPVSDEGMVRVYPGDAVMGAGGFTMGSSESVDPGQWTDDGSGYAGLQAGLEASPDKWRELPAGGEVTWGEVWYPVAGIGGVQYASDGGAVNLTPVPNGLRVGVFPTTAFRGELGVTLPGMAPASAQVEGGPEHPIVVDVLYPAAVPERGEVTVTLTDSDGVTVVSYTGLATLR